LGFRGLGDHVHGGAGGQAEQNGKDERGRDGLLHWIRLDVLTDKASARNLPEGDRGVSMHFSSGRTRILAAAACMGAPFGVPLQAVAAVPDDAWAAFSGMAGSCWAGERELSCFEWEFPGEMIRQVTYAPEQGQGEVRYQLDAAGTGVDGDDGSHMHAPRPGVTVREVAGSNPMRITYRHQDDKLWITIERQVGGRWAVARAEQRTRATEAQIEAAHAAVQAMRDASRKDWGVLTDLAGRHFLFQGRAAYAFYWTEAG